MKIGILTLPLHTNYGGILQAYALQTVLERMGHDVVIFQRDYSPIKHIPYYLYPLVLLKRLVWKCFVNHKTIIFWEKQRKNELTIIRKNTNEFISQYIHIRKINQLTDISPSEIDAIIVGSDQIWRKKYVNQIWQTDIQNAFLNFANSWHIRRIAYAVSFGVEKWEYDKSITEECRKLAERFNAISVREDSGVYFCKKYLGVPAKQLLDPTLLLEKQDYVKLINRVDSPSHTDGLFNYILDETPEKTAFVNRVSNERKMHSYRIVLYGKDIYAPVEKRILPSVQEWLKCFYDAKFIITDSFHGCVFSIILGKPFIAIGNKKRGLSRFTSLFNLLGLEGHLILGLEDYSPTMSYELPDNLPIKLDELKKISHSFLEDSLLS